MSRFLKPTTSPFSQFALLIFLFLLVDLPKKTNRTLLQPTFLFLSDFFDGWDGLSSAFNCSHTTRYAVIFWQLFCQSADASDVSCRIKWAPERPVYWVGGLKMEALQWHTEDNRLGIWRPGRAGLGLLEKLFFLLLATTTIGYLVFILIDIDLRQRLYFSSDRQMKSAFRHFSTLFKCIL